MKYLVAVVVMVLGVWISALTLHANSAPPACHYLYLPLILRSASAAADADPGAPAAAATYVGGSIPVCGTPVYPVLPGAGIVMTAGASNLYGIPANHGGSYRLVWTGTDTSQHFTGSIWTGGTFSVFNPGCSGGCPVGASGVISSPVSLAGGGQRIDFDTYPGGSVVGLDFVVSAEPAYFDLFVNGARNPVTVNFIDSQSSSQVFPGSIPFALTMP